MEKKELMYEGKAKKVYATENPDYCVVEEGNNRRQGRCKQPHVKLYVQAA